MIKPLRKRHLQIWSLWALLLPLGIIAATVSRKPTANDNFAPPQNGKTLPLVVAEKQLGENLLQLRGSTPGEVKQLLWVNREPLTVASATIYLLQPGATTIDSAAYIGRIETRGNYVFDLPAQEAYHFLLYDFIHQQVIGHVAISGGVQPHANIPVAKSTTTNPKIQTFSYER